MRKKTHHFIAKPKGKFINCKNYIPQQIGEQCANKGIVSNVRTCLLNCWLSKSFLLLLLYFNLINNIVKQTSEASVTNNEQRFDCFVSLTSVNFFLMLLE